MARDATHVERVDPAAMVSVRVGDLLILCGAAWLALGEIDGMNDVAVSEAAVRGTCAIAALDSTKISGDVPSSDHTTRKGANNE